jgi:hypothetical protein
VKQVQEWLGHADPGFTLRTYVHLMDEGLGDAAFFDHLEPRELSGAAGFIYERPAVSGLNVRLSRGGR